MDFFSETSLCSPNFELFRVPQPLLPFQRYDPTPIELTEGILEEQIAFSLKMSRYLNPICIANGS